MTKRIFICLFAFLLGLLSIIKKPVKADWMMNAKGDIISVDYRILGEEDEEDRSPTITTSPVNEIESEHNKENNERIEKTFAKPEPRKVNAFPLIRHDQIRELRIESTHEGKLKLHTIETKERKHEQEQKELEIETEDEPVHIATGEAEDEIKIKHGSAEARLKHRLSFDPGTKTFTVTTPHGNKTLTILPEKAMENFIHLNIIDNASKEAHMQLGEVDNELVYKIEGKKEKRLFGIFPILLNKEAFVSAQTGKLLKINESFLTKILSFFSF